MTGAVASKSRQQWLHTYSTRLWPKIRLHLNPRHRTFRKIHQTSSRPTRDLAYFPLHFIHQGSLRFLDTLPAFQLLVQTEKSVCVAIQPLQSSFLLYNSILPICVCMYMEHTWVMLRWSMCKGMWHWLLPALTQKWSQYLGGSAHARKALALV